MANNDSSGEEAATTPTPDDSPLPPRLQVTLKQHRPGVDPYTAALSEEHEIAPHHLLTLASKATRLGSSTLQASTGKEDADAASIISQHLPQWMRDMASRESRTQSMVPLLVFQNPWESFQAPGLFAAWHGGLQWGLPDGYVEGGEHHSKYRGSGRHKDQDSDDDDVDADAVTVVEPVWQSAEDADDAARHVRVTWLGHASTLVQLPNGTNILFDPIFVDRASPSQTAGPIRFTKPPCQVSDLPQIDIVCISHNHYDHLSWECIKKLRDKEKDRGGIKIFCPLGNISFFHEAGFDEGSVVEMDWWDEAEVQGMSGPGQVRLVCTPAQHGSGRGGGDQSVSLWSSWLVEYTAGEGESGGKGGSTFRVFFAGDTGLRSHNSSRRHRHEFPACPVFREISIKYGVPQLLLLPISVGSSLSYFRSWDLFPRRFSPFPRVEASMTSAIHMDAEDAAHCHQIMSLAGDEDEAAQEARRDVAARGVTSLAVHFGTFVRNEEQTRADVRDLRKACKEKQITFARTRNGRYDVEDSKDKGRFLVSNQGETVYVPL